MSKDYSVLDELTPKTQELHRAIFDKGYKQGVNDGSLDVKMRVEGAYEKSLNDAWDCAKKIVCDLRQDGYSLDTLLKIFGTTSLGYIFWNFSASEAIAKIKEYEEKQKVDDDKIKVGDEVILDDMLKGVILDIDDFYIYGLVPNTHLFKEKKDGHFYKRTGRHFNQITEILKQLKEEEHGTNVED